MLNLNIKASCKSPTAKSTRLNRNNTEISQQLKEKAEFIKKYIECKYKKLKQEESIKTEAWERVKIEMAKLGLAKEEQELITKEILHREAELNRKWRAKVSVNDFVPIAIIGKGAVVEIDLIAGIAGT